METHEQHELDRNKVVILKHEVLRIVKQTFCDAYETHKNRSPEDQNVIGNLITVLESELKKQIKEL
jgi:hypothetical protein